MTMDAVRTGIVARRSRVLGCYVQLGRAAGRVISVSFPHEPDPGASTDDPLLDRLDEYLDGADETFENVPIALTVSSPHRDVLERLRAVRPGESVTVEQLVRMTPGLEPEASSDHDIVRTVLEGNPVPIIVPDHRVADAEGATPPALARTLRTIEAGRPP